MSTSPNIAEQFAIALHMAAHSWKTALDRRLKPVGLGRAAWMLLAAVSRSPKAPTQIELADVIGVEAASMVAQIDRLERAGLLQRVLDDSDRRVKRIKATAKGRSMYAKIAQEGAASREELLAGVPAADIAAAVRLLDKVRENAEALA